MVDGDGRTVSEEHVVVESVFPEVVLVETVGYVVGKNPVIANGRGTSY